MSPSSVLDIFQAMVSSVGQKLAAIFLSPAPFSLASLLSALAVATLFVALARERRRKQIKLKVLLRAIFPRRLLRSASSKADVGFFLFNSFLATALFGWAILSYHLVSTTAAEALAGAFGARQPTALSEVYCAGVLTWRCSSPMSSAIGWTTTSATSCPSSGSSTRCITAPRCCRR
jgi:hypothetical protein